MLKNMLVLNLNNSDNNSIQPQFLQEEQKKYQEKFQKINPKSPVLKNIFWAFLVGGTICTIGQFFINYFIEFGLDKKAAASATSATLILISAILTGLGLYDELGRVAGAGSVVPITGFANSVVAPALEFKREGFLFGVGAKMFVIAGPVLVYGLLTSMIIGFIYWLKIALF